jgi:hypothetical protein
MAVQVARATVREPTVVNAGTWIEHFIMDLAREAIDMLPLDRQPVLAFAAEPPFRLVLS